MSHVLRIRAALTKAGVPDVDDHGQAIENDVLRVNVLADERDRYRDALEDIEARLRPHRERLSSQQAKDAYDIAADALNQPEPSSGEPR